MGAEVKERQIIMMAHEVRPTIAGTMTQFRRAVNPRGIGFIGCCCGGTAARWVREGSRWHCGTCGGGARLTQRDVEYLRCPYGAPGDLLWVREAWRVDGHAWGGVRPRDIDPGSAIAYEAGGHYVAWPAAMGKLRPSIHMPRWASRITLRVTDVRVERLQDISEADAKAEGSPLTSGSYSHRGWYRELWGEINGPGSWDANPWVWVVGFERV